MAFAISSTARINCVILLGSVPEADVRRYEDLRSSIEPVLAAEKCPFFAYQVGSAGDLQNALDEVADKCREGASPILQFLMHGSEEKGLICADGSAVPWHVAQKCLQTINYLTGNNLVVVSSVCYSFLLLKKISILESVPFYALIAPERKTYQDFVEMNTSLFYLDIFTGEDLLNAYYTHLAQEFAIFHSEAMLFVSLVRYFRDNCLGKAAISRAEDILTTGRQMGAIKNRKDLRRHRRSIKRMIKPNESVLQKFRATFLLGRDLSYNAGDLEKIARQARNSQHAEALAELKLAKGLKRA